MPSCLSRPVLAGVLAMLANVAAAAEPGKLAELVARKAAAIAILHQKAARALTTLAQDPSYAAYFRADDDVEREHLKQRIDRISLAVQGRFAVTEMCLINRSGQEVSRIVRDQVALDLDPDETDNAFFHGALASPPREVFVSPPYFSADAERWVIGNATTVAVEGQVAAVLHYEHDLERFAELLLRDLPKGVVLIAADEGGHMLIDSRLDSAARARRWSSPDDLPAFVLAGHDAPGLRRALGAAAEVGAGVLKTGGTEVAIAYRPVGGWTLFALAVTNEEGPRALPAEALGR